MDALNQAQSNGAVVGLARVDSIAMRMDIDQMLAKNPNQFNLFLLALTDLMADKEMNNVMAYFQLAGIHGMPLQTWDGVAFGGKSEAGVTSGGFGMGYCAHSTSIFPTWHRPYLAAIEQSLFHRMLKIADQYAQQYRQTYRDAVKGFRLPYWDYFRPREEKEVVFSGVRAGSQTRFPYDFRLPDIFTRREVMIKTVPNNELVSKRNPLYSYYFPQIQRNDGLIRAWTVPRGSDTWPSSGRTQRYPFSSTPTSDINGVLNKNREGNNEIVFDMMLDALYSRFSNVVSNEFVRGGEASGSLEGVHGDYHVNIGGTGGQMSRTMLAGFDPVFWIHHCSIDRLFAIWQAIHPDEWFPAGSGADNWDLLPFRYESRSQSSRSQRYWDSNDCRDTRALGYSYADIYNKTARQVRDEFEAKYKWQIRTGPGFRPVCPPSMLPIDTKNAQVFQSGTVRTAAMAASSVMTSSLPTAQSVMASVTPNFVGAGKDRSTANKPSSVSPGAGDLSQRVFSSIGDSAISSLDADELDESTVVRRWFVDNIVERLALNGSFTIYYFIGDFDDSNVNGYALAPTLCGISHNFAAPVEACDNCGNQALSRVKVTNTTPITPMLLDYIEEGELTNLSPEYVKPFLVKNLKWRIVKSDNSRVDPRTVAGLKVGVSSKLTSTATGEVQYQDFPEIVQQILENAS